MYNKPKFAVINTIITPEDCINGAGVTDYWPPREWEI